MYSGSRAAAARAPARPAAGSAAVIAASGGHQVPGEPLVAGSVLAGDHRRLGHPRAGGQHRLDLARLDPEPADLDLIIGPPGEHQLARPARPLGQVPGPVHPLPADPNGHAMNRSAVSPARPRYPRASSAPAMYSSPAIPAGTGSSHSSSTNSRVFATGAPIGGCPFAAADHRGRYDHRRLGRPVGMRQPPPRPPPCRQPRRQRLGPCHQPGHPRPGGRVQHLQQRRHHAGRHHPGPPHQRGQPAGSARSGPGRDHQRAARRQR